MNDVDSISATAILPESTFERSFASEISGLVTGIVESRTDGQMFTGGLPAGYTVEMFVPTEFGSEPTGDYRNPRIRISSEADESGTGTFTIIEYSLTRDEHSQPIVERSEITVDGDETSIRHGSITGSDAGKHGIPQKLDEQDKQSLREHLRTIGQDERYKIRTRHTAGIKTGDE